jgi:uncharacterized BrkB/YihY/UPF0761 family membrane protein
MAAIVTGLLALGAFVHLSRRAEAGDSGAVPLALFEMFLLIGFAAFGVLVAAYLAVTTCDEACDGSSSEWWHRTDAWQWDAQLVVAAAGLAALVSAFVFTRRRRHRQAVWSGIGAAVCFGVWAALLAPLGNGLGI